MKKLILLLMMPSLILNCTNKDSNPARGDSSDGNAFTVALSALENATPNFNGGSSVLFSPKTAIDSNWDVANSFPNLDGGSVDSTIVDYMGDLMGDSTDNSIFSRAGTPFMIACTIEQLAEKTGSIYTTGTQNIDLDISNLSDCGTSEDYGPVADSTVQAVISNLSTTTQYDQKVVLSASANPQFGGKEQTMFVKNNSTTLNFLHIETDSFSAATDTFVTVISYDKATGSGYFQYASINTNAKYLYRIVMNAASDSAKTFTYFNDSTRSVTTHAGSLFTSQDDTVLSVSWTGLTGSPIGANGTDNNGCIDTTASPPVVSQDNSLTCTANGVSISAVSSNTAAAAIDALSAQDLADVGATDGAGSAFAPSFTVSTILSASLGF